MYPNFSKVLRENCTEKRSRILLSQVPGVPGNKSGFWTLWTLFPVFPESIKKEVVQKKDPGNRENGVHGARIHWGIYDPD